MSRRNSLMVSKTLYQIGLLTLFTAILWTVLAVVKSINTAPKKIDVDPKLLEPINIGIDKPTLDILLSRKKIEADYVPLSNDVNLKSESEIASRSANKPSSDTIEEDTKR